MLTHVWVPADEPKSGGFFFCDADFSISIFCSISHFIRCYSLRT